LNKKIIVLLMAATTALTLSAYRDEYGRWHSRTVDTAGNVAENTVDATADTAEAAVGGAVNTTEAAGAGVLNILSGGRYEDRDSRRYDDRRFYNRR